jgi:aryl-alcohol dehydrogenase-like predicted oxidoreductase
LALETITVPGTDLAVSRVVLGTMTFGSQVDAELAGSMVDAAADAGINAIDTANVYNAGASEEIVGQSLKGRRGEFVLASKVGMPSADADGTAPLSRAAIRACLQSSLERLDTDYLDIYYLHQPDRTTPIEETLEALQDAVAAGMVRHIAVSNFAAWQLAELRGTAIALGFPLPTLSQPLYNLVARRIEEEYVEFSARAGLINVVYNPLGGGLLTGKHQLQTDPVGDGRFGTAHGLGQMYRQRYWNEPLFEAVEALRSVAAGSGLSMVELAFRWLLGTPAVGAVLLGASRQQQLEANLAACAGPSISDDVRLACDRVWNRLRGPSPAYNR